MNNETPYRMVTSLLLRVVNEPATNVFEKLALVSGAVIIAMLADPGVASAATASTTLTLPSYLWVTAAAGGAAAVAVVVGTACWIWHLDRSILHAPIGNASAWDFKDSWVTNLTGLGGVISGIFTQSALSSFLISGINKDGFTVMSLLFGGVAIMGPVIYGAFGMTPPKGANSNNLTAPTASNNPVGSSGGLLAANLVTLFATFGLLGDVGLLVNDTIATTPDKIVIVAGLVLAAVVVTIYAVRSATLLVTGESGSSTLMSAGAHRSGTL